MPIPRTDLDDKPFAKLVEQAIKTVPRRAPDWTNHNPQDPGITLVELFAWLTEMQQYYLNQIGEANYRKYLKLLGERPAEAKLAKADVTFGLQEDVSRDVVIPKGTKLCTDDNVVFETVEELLLTPPLINDTVIARRNRPAKVLSSSLLAGMRDNTDVNIPRQQPPFFAFGEQAEPGSRLYLGFTMRHFFTWHDLPGAHSDRVREFLSRRPGLKWIETARIQKVKYDKIVFQSGNHEAALIWDDGGVVLQIVGEPSVRDGFYAKGPEAEVFLQPFSAGNTISLSFTLFEDFPVQAGRHDNETATVFPSASICWEYSDRRGLWSPLPIGCDSTNMFTQSGRLYFTAPLDMWPLSVSPFSETLYWLRATVKEAGYELPPQIDTILLNTVSAIQRDSLSEMAERSSDGRPNQSFDISSYLALKGKNLVQVREGSGCWRDWEVRNDFSTSGPGAQHCVLTADPLAGKVTIAFGDGKNGKIPPEDRDGKPTIRLISFDTRFEHQRFLGRSNGLPNQVFKLDQSSVVVESLLVQVRVQRGNANETAGEYWCDWQLVDDFDASSKNDRHYVFDPITSEFRFGDGVNGDIPPSAVDGEPNIRLVACQIGGGARGNVQAGAIKQLTEPITDLAPPRLVRRQRLMVLSRP